eukprot:2007198-Rhodomonas_salina.3
MLSGVGDLCVGPGGVRVGAGSLSPGMGGDVECHAVSGSSIECQHVGRGRASRGLRVPGWSGVGGVLAAGVSHLPVLSEVCRRRLQAEFLPWQCV